MPIRLVCVLAAVSLRRWFSHVRMSGSDLLLTQVREADLQQGCTVGGCHPAAHCIRLEFTIHLREDVAPFLRGESLTKFLPYTEATFEEVRSGSGSTYVRSPTNYCGWQPPP